MSGRLEALHDPFSSPGRLMGILRPVVQAFVRAMLDARHDIALCRATGSQLVGDHDARRVPLSFHKLSHKAFGGLGIAAALHQYVENKAVLIDGAPKPVFLAGDRDDITPVYKQEELVRLFPSAHLEVIKNVGHLTHYETPDHVARFVEEFIASPGRK